MEVREGYKQTEVGVIPEDWVYNKLGVLLKIRHGKSQHEIEEATGRFPILGTGGEIGRTNNYLYNKPSVLIGRKGTIDKPKYMDTPFWTVDTLFYSEVSSSVHPKFLYYKFTTIDWYSYNEASGVPSLNAKTIENIVVTIPPKPEQKAIAQALSDTDALIDSLEKLIEKKQCIKQGAMQELLTGKRRLPGFEVKKGYKQTEIGEIPEDWEIVKLNDAVEFLDGQRKPIKSADREKISGIYPYYGASGIIDYVNSYIFDDELILLGEDGENILSRSSPLAFKVSGKMWVNNHAHVLKVKKNFEQDFLVNYLESLDYSLLNSGTAQPKLNKRACMDIKIINPPTLEQEAIATILSDMDSEIEALETKLQKTREIKESMMHELLTGRIRLI